MHLLLYALNVLIPTLLRRRATCCCADPLRRHLLVASKPLTMVGGPAAPSEIAEFHFDPTQHTCVHVHVYSDPKIEAGELFCQEHVTGSSALQEERQH